MEILDRVKSIIRANLNDLKDNGDDGEKAALLMADMAVQAAELKKSAADSVALKNKLSAQLEEIRAKRRRYSSAAKKALAQGNDGDARILLEKDHDLSKREETLAEQYEQAETLADNCTDAYNKQAAELSALKTRYDSLRVRKAAADAAIKSGKADSGDIDELLDRLESEADNAEANAEAEEFKDK